MNVSENLVSVPAKVYDVVVMGAGFAGVCQARHLLLKVPNLKIALIDPRSLERSDKDLKVGESTVEISSMFMYKELGLYEYLIEHHCPKHGLSFHWPKNQSQTESCEDYFHIWTASPPPLESFQINRAKFEQDVLKMNLEMGAEFYNGRVADVNLTVQDELHTVKVKLAKETVELKAKHLIDAAGRSFILGKKTDNLMFDPEQLYGINTGSSWLRVKNIDRTILDDGYDPANSAASRYYTTNHFFGHGHWIWMLPIERNERELSIGIVYHKNIIPTSEINKINKFKAFLKANHNLVYNIIESGETVDFHNLPRLAHMSKKIISQDNWYILGDAAHMFDPFYSSGLVLTALSIESVTEAIRSKLAQEPDARQKQADFNQFLLTNARTYNFFCQKHEKHLGNASVMSWRTYSENMLWFGVLLPMYVGKWFLNSEFISHFVKIANFLFFAQNSFFNNLHRHFDELVDDQVHIGLMDFTRNDQLLFGYRTSKEFDHYLGNTKFEPLRCNVFAGMKATMFYLTLYYLKFRFKSYGILGMLSPRSLFYVFQLLSLSAYLAMGEQIYLFKTRHLPDNTFVEKMKKDFKNYKYEPKLQPWGEKAQA